MTISFQTHGAMGDKIVQTENFGGRLAGAGMALWFYLGKVLLPLNLNLIYPRWQIDAAAPLSYLPLSLWGGVLALAWRFRHSWGRPMLFGLGCFTVTLFPVLGFLDMYFLALSRVSDHFQYLPLIAVLALVSAGLHILGEKSPHAKDAARWSRKSEIRSPKSETNSKRWKFPNFKKRDEGISTQRRKDAKTQREGSHFPATQSSCHLLQKGSQSLINIINRFNSFNSLAALPGLLVLGLSALTFQRAQLFANGEALWRDTLAKNPAAWCAHNNLGTILAEQQQYAAATEHFLASLRLDPGNAPAHSNLGIILSQEGRFEEAEGHFLAALRTKPRDPAIHWAHATALVKAGNIAEGTEQAREAVRLDSGIVHGLQFATLLYQTGHRREAIAEYRELLELMGPWGQRTEGRGQRPEGRGQRPEDRGQRTEVLSNLAWLLATSPEATLRDGPEAVRFAAEACRLTDYKQALTVGVLAAADAEAGHFDEAVAMAEKAVELATAEGNLQFAAKNQELLELYRAGKAYHER
jgi:tetratricopeptide (TPR) repeat protein